MIVEIALAGAVYVAYREYKSGKLKNIVTAVETRVASLEASAKAEVAKVVSVGASAEVKTAVVAVEAEVATEVAKVV
jgi:hypothetical protein